MIILVHTSEKETSVHIRQGMLQKTRNLYPKDHINKDYVNYRKIGCCTIHTVHTYVQVYYMSHTYVQYVLCGTSTWGGYL
jgi:hypothetical protein